MTKHGTNWVELAESLGAFDEIDGLPTEGSSSESAAELVCKQLGNEFILSAVDHYMASEPGMETARSVLQLLRPFIAMERCNQIIEDSHREDERESAMELLRSFADHRAITWLPRYLKDPNPNVRIWAIYLLSELCPTTIEPDEAKEFIQMLPPDRTGSIGVALNQLHEELQKYDAK